MKRPVHPGAAAVVAVLALAVASLRLGSPLTAVAQPRPGDEGAALEQATPARTGRRVYGDACAACHGLGGDGRLGPALAGNSNLANADYVAAIVLRGGDGMPAFHGRLTEAEVLAVTDYVGSAWGNDFARLGGAELAGLWWRGADDPAGLFDRACARCHGADGGGGFGPPLAGNDNLQDTQYVVGKILHGQGGMPAFEGILDETRIAALAEHVRTAFGNGFGEVAPTDVSALADPPAAPSGSLRTRAVPEDARVTILGPDGFFHFAATGGEIRLDGLAPGEYVVTATHDDFEPSVTTIRVSSGSQASPAAEAYLESCAPCHGPAGGGGVGPPLAGNPILEDAERLIDLILHGSGRMPAFGPRLPDDVVAAVAGHERNSWGNDFGPVDASAVAALRRDSGPGPASPGVELAGGDLYREHCARCHGGTGSGAVGPALRDNASLADTSYVLSRIVMGGDGMPAFHGTLSSAELAALATFLRTSWGNGFGPVATYEAQNYHGGVSSLAR